MAARNADKGGRERDRLRAETKKINEWLRTLTRSIEGMEG